MERNIIEGLESMLKAAVPHASFVVKPLQDVGAADLAIIVADTDAPDTRKELAHAAASKRDVDAVRRARQRLLVRLSDERICEIGRSLERGETLFIDHSDLFRDLPYVVDFFDPNASKGIHVGHLRNIALGNALASSLAMAGASVCRQSVISDGGQQTAEAMAGYVQYGEAVTPKEAGEKGDHFVGRWYTKYLNETNACFAEVQDADIPVARELSDRDDLAMSLYQRWKAGESATRELWETVRTWVVEGQRETLTRLGVVFDYPLYETSYFDQLTPMVNAGIRTGIFHHQPDGALVYRTGRREYPIFPLARPDGFPTLNLRNILAWYEMMPELSDVTMFHVCGMEWMEHTIFVEQILENLTPKVSVQPTRYVLHGMVESNNGIISSSNEDAPLADDLLDDLIGSQQLTCLQRVDALNCAPEDLAVMTILGFCLDRPLLKPLLLTPERLLDPERSSGLLFARIWSEVWNPLSNGEASPDPKDPVYRFVVVQSQVQRQLLSLALDRLDPLLIIRHLARLSEWYLRSKSSPSADRLMRTLLGEGFRSLGILRPAALSRDRSRRRHPWEESRSARPTVTPS